MTGGRVTGGRVTGRAADSRLDGSAPSPAVPPDLWTRLEAVVPHALDLDRARRAAYLDGACTTADGRPDARLRAEAERLIEAAVEADAAGALLSPFDGIEDGIEDGDPGSLPGPVGPWHPTARLGAGGMGVVYAAERADASFRQRAALKLVRPGFGPDFRARFVRERAVLAGLDHPNVARLIDGGVTADGLPYLAMELVDGEPITDYAERHGLATADRLGLFLQACDAVAHAHRALVVHRDLKPSNILVTPEGGTDGRPSVKLLDFGIAKLLGDETDALTRSGPGPMSLPYAAPEQFLGRPVTTATDVYALGVVLYELLAGHRPFALAGLTAAEAERVVTTAVPPRPSARADSPARARALRGDLDTVVLKALAKEPARRYATVDAFADDLRRYAGGKPVRARPDTPGYRARKFVSRNRWAAAATAAVAVGAAALVGFYTARLADERDRALAAQATAEQVSAFLQRIVTAPSYKAWHSEGEAFGPETPIRAVLDEAAARLDTAALDPATRADLHVTIGGTYGALGDPDGGLRHALAALRIREALHAPSHPDLAEALYGLAVAHVRLGDEAAALPFYRRAVAMLRARNEGNNFPFMAQELANRLRRAGRLAEADALLREALAFAEATFRGGHPGARYRPMLRAVLHGDLSLNAYLRGDLDEAEREAGHADRAVRTLPPGVAHARWQHVRCVAGTTAAARGRDATADLLACAGDPDPRAAVSPFPPVPAGRPETVPAIHDAIAGVYDRLGRPSDAARSRAGRDSLAQADAAYRRTLVEAGVLGPAPPSGAPTAHR